ncbi:hypothetical protein BDZ97DRAFT_785822 [Flammula alnicola]|nr:hypothetical protein BDZ97DRAFT_785822 [Flammula alnicola]
MGRSLFFPFSELWGVALLMASIFNNESLSLRSFRVNAVSHSPPSLKASSLKFGRSFNLRGRPGPAPSQPRLKDLADDCLFEMGLPPDSSSKMPHSHVNSASDVQTEQATVQRPRSKTRTIIRMISTKFTPRSASTPISHTAVRMPTVANAYSKEQRDAALRERGLLPPLPHKDLSAQEQEQDRRIPIVHPTDENPESSEDPSRNSTTSATHLPSAADLIKKEWEAKNHTVDASQRERMNAFKFGGVGRKRTCLRQPWTRMKPLQHRHLQLRLCQ